MLLDYCESTRYISGLLNIIHNNFLLLRDAFPKETRVFSIMFYILLYCSRLDAIIDPKVASCINIRWPFPTACIVTRYRWSTMNTRLRRILLRLCCERWYPMYMMKSYELSTQSSLNWYEIFSITLQSKHCIL